MNTATSKLIICPAKWALMLGSPKDCRSKARGFFTETIELSPAPGTETQTPVKIIKKVKNSESPKASKFPRVKKVFRTPFERGASFSAFLFGASSGLELALSASMPFFSCSIKCLLSIILMGIL